MCVSPIILKNENPKIYEVYKSNIVPCGKCWECMQSRQSSWRFRLIEEMKISDNAYFVTLTYDDGCITYNHLNQQDLDYKDLQRYFKKYRQSYLRKFGVKSKLKYFAVGEYGSKTARPHYHIIAFNVDIQLFKDTWNLGLTHHGTVTEGSITYTLKYCLKRAGKIRKGDLRKPEKALISKGIGLKFLTPEMAQYFKADPTRMARYFDKKVALPRYYRDKIFDEKDKQIRYEHILNLPVNRNLDERFAHYVRDKHDKIQKSIKKTD